MDGQHADADTGAHTQVLYIATQQLRENEAVVRHAPAAHWPASGDPQLRVVVGGWI